MRQNDRKLCAARYVAFTHYSAVWVRDDIWKGGVVDQGPLDMPAGPGQTAFWFRWCIVSYPAPSRRTLIDIWEP